MSTDADTQVVFLVNPASANGSTGRHWPELEARAHALGLAGETRTSERPGHLVELAENVGREEGRWILGTGPWRPVADERRYLRTIQGYPDAAVYVAEDGDRIVGRLSLSRDPHPASRHVADLGLMVAVSHRRRVHFQVVELSAPIVV